MPEARSVRKTFSSFKARPDLDYMTVGERNAFKAGRDSGAISFFRVRACSAGCGMDVPKSKLFCSKECYDGYGEQIARARGEADDDNAEGDAE